MVGLTKLSQDEYCAKLVCLRKFSIFCRKSSVLKAIAHVISDNIRKTIKFFQFLGVIKGSINYTFSGRTMCKFFNFGGNLQFLIEILEF